MGRTNPTYRRALDGLESEWRPMRRALRGERQGDFDRLFERAHNLADAAGYANPPDPERALLVSLLVAHETELRRLRAALEAERGDAEEDGSSGREGDTEGDGASERDGDSSEGGA